MAGLDPKTNEPFIAGMDLIGCPMEADDFIVGGTCTEQLYGMCESLWKPDMVHICVYMHMLYMTCTTNFLKEAHCSIEIS